MQLQFSFFFEFFFFAYAVTVSNFSDLFIYAATVFFLPELILHKYSVEGYIGVVVLMRLGAFVGFVRRCAFMCGKISRGTRTRRGQGWRPKKEFWMSVGPSTQREDLQGKIRVE